MCSQIGSIPAPVMTYFIGSTVIAFLLIAILVFWKGAGKPIQESHLKTVGHRQPHREKKRKHR